MWIGNRAGFTGRNYQGKVLTLFLGFETDTANVAIRVSIISQSETTYEHHYEALGEAYPW